MNMCESAVRSGSVEAIMWRIDGNNIKHMSRITVRAVTLYMNYKCTLIKWLSGMNWLTLQKISHRGIKAHSCHLTNYMKSQLKAFPPPAESTWSTRSRFFIFYFFLSTERNSSVLIRNFLGNKSLKRNSVSCSRWVGGTLETSLWYKSSTRFLSLTARHFTGCPFSIIHPARTSGSQNISQQLRQALGAI